MSGYGEGTYGEGIYGGGTGPETDPWIPTTLTGQDSLKWFSDDTTSTGTTPVYSNTIVIPAQTTTSVLYDFPVRVRIADLTAGWKAGLVDRGSGTIRVRDQSGTDVPFDLVWVDETLGFGDLFFKAPKVNRLLDTYFTIDLVSGATPPAVTDPLGRNAVWSDYDAVFLDGLTINRTGSGNNLVGYNPADTTGNWFTFSGIGGGVAAVPHRTTWTIGGTFRTDGTAEAGIASYTSSGAYTGTAREVFSLDNGTNPGIWNSTNAWLYEAGALYSNGSSERFNYQYTSSGLRKVYRNGLLSNAYPGTTAPGGSGDWFVVGASDLNTVPFGGGVTTDTVADQSLNPTGGNYMTFPKDGLPQGNAPFSIELWVNRFPYATTCTQCLNDFGTYGTGNTNRDNAISLINTTISHRFWGNDLTTTATVGNSDIWHYIVVTWDGANRKIYYNASVLASDTPASTPVVQPYNPRIGCGNASEFYSGRIDEVAIYNYALTPTQISNHYSQRTVADAYEPAVLADTPVTYFRMKDSGIVATDSSGNGHHGVYASPVEPYTGQSNRLYLRNGVLSDSWLSAERTSWEDTLAFYYVTEDPPPAVTAFDHVWWDGSSYQPAILRGWWDGTSIQPVNVLGWWDGTSIQPMNPAS
jgi:hypothetical protein